jgi:hypothetical protein
MKRTTGSVPYCLLLLSGLMLVLAGIDLFRHFLAGHSASVPPHNHFTLEQLIIIGFAFLLYISGRFGLLHLNLNLCFLGLFLAGVRLAYELKGGEWGSAALADVVLFVLLVPLLVSLASYPLRTLSAETGQDFP